MSGKIVLNLAMSLDGYIADEAGGYGWIVWQGNQDLDTKTQLDFNGFLQDIDIVVMGKNCYDQNMHKDYPYHTKSVYIATNSDLKDYDNIHFIKGDIVNLILKEKSKGKNIYLFGGGKLVDNFIKSNVIDEYIIGIVPTILGKGRPLFYENNPEIKLYLNEYIIQDGFVIMKYKKR